MRLPEITEEDINKAEAEWCLRKPLDSERRAVLRCMETVDIRACPGSGKTTLLALKLGILANKWKYEHRGVCVLSHTNVARSKIEQQIGRAPSLDALMHYPHSVSTIQTFLHTFFATPAAIERFGIRPAIVDNNQYGIEARKEFIDGSKQHGRYATANIAIREWIRQNPEYDWPSDYVSHIQYIDENLSLPQLGTKGLSVSWSTKTGQELSEFKERMSRQGIFRYQDMAALAAWYLKRHPGIANPLEQRFPIVFFDEMQDTMTVQGNLLDAVFSGHSVVQRFGDDRQAIYHDTANDCGGAHFPRGDTLPMRSSFRLSASIARLSQSVCADNPPEDLIGDESKPDRRHTLFVFKRDSIKKVLPAFCRLVVSEVGSGLNECQVRAVGANSRAKPEAGKFPSAIGDYWDDFVPRNEQVQQRLTNLTGYFEKARTEMMTNKRTGEGRTLLLDACAKMLRLQGVITDKGRQFTPTGVIYQLRKKSSESYRRFNTLLARTCQALLSNEQPDRAEFADQLRPLFEGFDPQPWNSDVRQFVSDTIENGKAARTSTKGLQIQDNVYRHETGDVSVKVDTIHSVKGEELHPFSFWRLFSTNTI